MVLFGVLFFSMYNTILYFKKLQYYTLKKKLVYIKVTILTTYDNFFSVLKGKTKTIKRVKYDVNL